MPVPIRCPQGHAFDAPAPDLWGALQCPDCGEPQPFGATEDFHCACGKDFKAADARGAVRCPSCRQLLPFPDDATKEAFVVMGRWLLEWQSKRQFLRAWGIGLAAGALLSGALAVGGGLWLHSGLWGLFWIPIGLGPFALAVRDGLFFDDRPNVLRFHGVVLAAYGAASGTAYAVIDSGLVGRPGLALAAALGAGFVADLVLRALWLRATSDAKRIETRLMSRRFRPAGAHAPQETPSEAKDRGPVPPQAPS